jgi:basic membrane protein A
VTFLRPLRSLVLGGLLLWGAAGCAPSPPTPEPVFSVRLLTSVTVSGRWEKEAEKGLGRIAAELDADIARSRAHGAAELREQLRSHAASGVDLVFCVGPEVEPLVFTEAVAFPDSIFVVIPGETHRPNVASVAFMPEEAGFLAGSVATSISEAPLVGVLRGTGRPWLERLEAGFVAGARSARDDVEVVSESGPEGPWRLASAGIEVALYSSDRIDPRVLVAAHDAGLSLISADPAVMASEPDLVIAAVEVDVAEAMLRVAREVRDRRFTGQVFAFDLGSGVLDLKLNTGLAPASGGRGAREALERARSEITAGWVEIEELGIGH